MNSLFVYFWGKKNIFCTGIESSGPESFTYVVLSASGLGFLGYTLGASGLSRLTGLQLPHPPSVKGATCCGNFVVLHCRRRRGGFGSCCAMRKNCCA